MNTSEKRKFKRLEAKLDIFCREIDSADKQSYIGRTVNVSPGGLFFHTSADRFNPDNVSQVGLFKIELSIPPTKGLLDFGGKISAFAKVLRATNLENSLPHNNYGVALEFCQSPKLSV